MHHLLAELKQIDFVTAWKAISIAFTGGFGILGLLKDFKNKRTHKITRWGWISLVGVIVSSVCGIAAQLKESAHDSAKALALAEKADKTLNEIERGLYPLEEPRAILEFRVPCEEQKYKTFCADVNKQGVAINARHWVAWPEPKNGQLGMEMDFFVDRPKSEEAPGAYTFNGNLALTVAASYTSDDKSLIAIPDHSGGVILLLANNEANVAKNDGPLKSLLDLYGVTLVLSSITRDLDGLRLQNFNLRTKSGQMISGESAGFTEKQTARDTIYFYH